MQAKFIKFLKMLAKFIIVQFPLESRWIVKLTVKGRVSEIQKKASKPSTMQNILFQSEMQSHQKNQ